MSVSGHCTSIINLRYRDGTEGSASNPAKFNFQDYLQLKHDHRRRGRLFVDYTFPPESQSLGFLPELSQGRDTQVEWIRPRDVLKAQNIDDDPVFCTQGASRFDFGQGVVGNCWFLAAISSLTFQKDLMVQVVPMEQNFDDYSGIFHFRFWRFGKWVDVVIDDYLPTFNNQLLSVFSKSGNEFWVPLLEKAYAKVCGSYADMSAGLPSEACKDFSGGLSMIYRLNESHHAGHADELWSSLTNATGCKSMICCGTAQKGGALVNTVAETGLVSSHAYSVTGVTQIPCDGEIVKLVRLMNPWGRKEWNGKWSDKSSLWSRVSPEDQKKCSDRDDGEFWMELEDFCHHFHMLFVCCENPNFTDGDFACQWKSMTYEGSWVAGKSAGGSRSYYSFAQNPQYRMQVTIINEEEVEDKNVFLSLVQKPRQRNRKEAQPCPIGLTIYKIPPRTPPGRLRSSFFRRNSPIMERQLFTYERDLTEQYSLQPGEYVIIPCTMKPHTSGEFVLTIYSKAETTISPHDGGDDDDSDDDDEENLILPETPTDHSHCAKDNKEEEALRTLFNLYADQYGELKVRQLQRLLNDKFPHGSFGLDTCGSLIAMVDIDQRKTMTFTEFSNLWEKVNKYERIFRDADFNRNGALVDCELKKAINAAGMEIDEGVLMLMTFRYSDASNLSLESFLALMLRLEKVSSLYENKSSDGQIHMSWDEWFTSFMYM